MGVFKAKSLGCDVLHIHAIGPSLFVPLARVLGLKVVMTHHGPDYERKKWNQVAKSVLKFGEALGVRWANQVITISQMIAGQIQKKYGRAVTVIPNGVVIPEAISSDAALRQYGLEKGKYILAVGRFVPEKGFHDLIAAFALAQKQGFPVDKLVIVGDADHEDQYSRDLKTKAQHSGNVVLTGRLTGIPLQEIYSHAGLFVLPSYYEGLPIALLEALSYGLSCVVSDIPANQEVGLEEARYFRPGDIEALAGKIKEFLAKPLSGEERQEQIKRIAERYNWDVIAQKTMEVYKAVVA